MIMPCQPSKIGQLPGRGHKKGLASGASEPCDVAVDQTKGSCGLAGAGLAFAFGADLAGLISSVCD